MSATRNLLVASVLAFAGGLVTGLIVAPHSGKKMRRLIAGRLQEEMLRMEGKLDTVEERMEELEEKVVQATHDLGERVMAATREAVDQVVPDLPDDPEEWEMKKGDVAGSLRKMPRS